MAAATLAAFKCAGGASSRSAWLLLHLGHVAQLEPSGQRTPAARVVADDYQPREAEATVLHQVVKEHLATFVEDASRRSDGAGLPRFVERELSRFLECGVLANGFARVRCGDCRFERLVPFSCKGRGFCPTCGGRRMVERAAHLVDEVLPVVPVRQWVLSLPHQLRYLVAWNHGLCRAVLAVYVRALLGFQRRRAKRAGISDGRSGAATVIQRFGSGLRLNVHFHTLVLDGVYTAESAFARPIFHPASELEDTDVAGLVHKDIANSLKFARMWGEAVFDGQQVGPDHLVSDGDLVELHA